MQFIFILIGILRTNYWDRIFVAYEIMGGAKKLMSFLTSMFVNFARIFLYQAKTRNLHNIKRISHQLC